MKRRLTFLIICLFGAASIIILSWSRSASWKFTYLTILPPTDEYPNWSHQLIHRMSHWIVNEAIPDDKNTTSLRYNDKEKNVEASTCPSILSGMIKGKWIKRLLTQQEQTTIDEYLRTSRAIHKVPASLQREDGRCGDVAYEQSPQYHFMLFKAICNPKGDTPCCHTNRCINASEADCRCPTCYDERQSIHAEYAQWKPEDDRCEIKNFTSLEACNLLNGTTLHFVGDSFIRHVFVAMVVLLANNPEGALKDNAPQKARDECRGMHHMTGHPCRDHLDVNRTLCGGTVKVGYTEIFAARDFYLARSLLQKLPTIKKSLIVAGLGIHDNFDIKKVSRQFLLPFLNLHKVPTTSSKSTVGVDNVTSTIENIGVSTSIFNSHSKTFSKTPNQALMSIFNKNEEKKSRSYLSGSSQLILDLPSAKETTARHVLSDNSILNMSKHLENVQSKHVTTKVNIYSKALEANNTQERRERSNFGLLTQDPTNLNTRKSDSVKVDNVNTSNLSIILRNAGVDDFLALISQRPPESTGDIQPWSRLLWIGAHSPGLLKSPKYREQTAAGVKNYNKNVYDILNDFKVPHLDTVGITEGVVSFDGTHYGWGINMLKANMVLTYIQQELCRDPEWRR